MSESAEVKRGLLGRTRPLLSCTLRLRWLESVCAPRHFDFTGRRSDRRPSCTRRSLPFPNASCVCHAVWTGTRTQRCCVSPSNRRCHTTTTAATAGTLSDRGRIRSGASKIVPTVPLTYRWNRDLQNVIFVTRACNSLNAFFPCGVRCLSRHAGRRGPNTSR